MPVLKLSVACLAVFLHGCASGSKDPPAALPARGAPIPARDLPDPAAQVRLLGSDDFETRGAAFARLLAWGAEDPERVLSALPETSEDPEVLQSLRKLRTEIPWTHREREVLGWIGRSEPLREPVRALFAKRDGPALGAFLRASGWWKRLSVHGPAMSKSRDGASSPADTARAPAPEDPLIGRDRIAQVAAWLLDVEDPETRCMAALVRGLLGELDPAVRQRLVRMGFDTEDPARAAAIEALGRSGDRSLIPDLEKMAQDPDQRIHSVAIAALGRLDAGESLLALLAASDPSIRRLAAEQFSELKEKKAPDALVRMVADADRGVSAAAARAIGRIGDPSAQEAAQKLLAHPSAHARVGAIEVLEGLGGERHADRIAQCLTDADRRVRLRALLYLGKIRSKKQIPAIAAMIREDDAEEGEGAAATATGPVQALVGGGFSINLNAAAVQTLGRIGDPSALPRVRETLGFRDRRTRAAAVEAVGELGGEEEIPRIADMLSDPEHSVQFSAALALARLAKQDWPKNARAVEMAKAWWAKRQETRAAPQ